MTKFKKSISILCIALTILSLVCIPLSASAKTYKGTSGSIQWSVNEGTGKLTISPKEKNGTGKIADYDKTTPPWDKYKSSIKHIVVGKKVTAIGKYPFKSLTKAVDVSVGEDVSSISLISFLNCTALTKINIASNNKKFSDVNGVFFNKDKTVLYVYPKSKSDTSYEIPASVKSIKTYAFYKVKNLKKITQASNKVTSIGDKVFANASNLATVIIKNNCEKIGEQVFNGSDKLTKVEIPPSVTTIGDSGKTLFSKKDTMKNLVVTIAPNSAIYKKLDGKGYKFSLKDYKFTVNFDARGGTAKINNTIINSAKVIFGKAYGELPTVTKDGYTFKGWFLNSKKVTKKTLVNTAKTHTLEAQYEAADFNIDLDADGGICDYHAITVTYDTPYGPLPSVSKAGYDFLGWFTEKGKRVYSDDIYKDTSVKKLCAHWQRTLLKVEDLKIGYKSKNSIKLSWKNQDDVTGYIVARKVKSNGKWSKWNKSYKTVKTNSFVDTKLSSTKKYQYAIRSYYENKYSGTSKGNWSSGVSRKPTYVGTPKIKVKYTKRGYNSYKAQISYKAKDATRYQIQKANKKKWVNVSKSTSEKKAWMNVNHGKTYTFRIRGFKKVLGHKFYGKYKKFVVKK